MINAGLVAYPIHPALSTGRSTYRAAIPTADHRAGHQLQASQAESHGCGVASEHDPTKGNQVMLQDEVCKPRASLLQRSPLPSL